MSRLQSSDLFIYFHVVLFCNLASINHQLRKQSDLFERTLVAKVKPELLRVRRGRVYVQRGTGDRGQRTCR